MTQLIKKHHEGKCVAPSNHVILNPPDRGVSCGEKRYNNVFAFWHKSSNRSGVSMSLVHGARTLGLAILLSFNAPIGAFAGSVADQGTWGTTLQARDLDGNVANGFEAYYDTSLDITWLADANYAKTTGFDVDGRMTWLVAKAWAQSLNIGGVTGWRLPNMVDTGAPGCNVSISGGTDCGYNVDTSTSELAHMYHVTLGNKSKANTLGQPQPGFGLTNSGPFNIPDYYFWTALEYAPRTSLAWDFEVGLGTQVTKNKANDLHAWVVRDGDVSAVPEPESWALALAGLSLARLVARRRC